MKKMLTLGLAVVTVLAIPALAAPTVKMLNDATPLYTLQVLSPMGDVGVGVYQSVCIEKNETFSPNQSYYAVVNEDNAAILGGSVWSGDFGSGTVVSSGGADVLDYRSSWLFKQYSIENPDFQNQSAIQNAIHYIEAENFTDQIFSAAWAGSATLWQQYVAAADAAVANGWNSFGGVRVLNLYADEAMTKHVQDQIVYVPTPGAILLAGIGTSLVGWLRRRQSL